jgi:hypothetical protein
VWSARIAAKKGNEFEIGAGEGHYTARIGGKRRASAASSAQAADQRRSFPVAVRRRFILRRPMVVRDKLGSGGAALAVRTQAYGYGCKCAQRHEGEQRYNQKKFQFVHYAGPNASTMN